MEEVLPDVCLLIGVRSFLSLLGICLIVYGGWRFDRRWEESESTDEFDGELVDRPGMVSGVNELITQYMDKAFETISNHENEGMWTRVRTVFASAGGKDLYCALSGWFLLAISLLLDRHHLTGWEANTPAWMAVISVLVLAVVESVILPTAVSDQWVHRRNFFFGTILLLGYVFLAIFATLEQGQVPVWLYTTACICIPLGHFCLWFHRKRGDGYDRGTVTNTRATLFGPGGPLVAAGWCMFWVAMNVTEPSEISRRLFLPLYWTSRTAVAFEGAFVIVAVYWLVNFSHDEADSTDPSQARFLIGITEIRVAFVLAYFVFAVAALLETGKERKFWPIVTFLAIIAMGFASGVQHVLGLRAGDAVKLYRWARVTLILSGFLAFVVVLSQGLRSGVMVYVQAAACGPNCFVSPSHTHTTLHYCHSQIHRYPHNGSWLVATT